MPTTVSLQVRKIRHRSGLQTKLYCCNCTYRDMSRLAKWSTLSIIFMLFILLTVFVRLFTLSDVSNQKMILKNTGKEEESWKYFDITGLPAAISIIGLAFVCHHNMFMLYCSIEDPTEQKASAMLKVEVPPYSWLSSN